MTGPEDLLTDALHERADRHDLLSTPIGDVVSTARGIRRRRRATTGVVAAAVLAVLATPFVISAVRGPHGPIGPSHSAPQVRLEDVALGRPPAVAWLDGDTYVAADGARTRLPLHHVVEATPYDGGFLVATEAARSVVLLDGQLHQVWRRCGQPVFAVSDDGTRTAYSTWGCHSMRGTLHLSATDGTAEQQTPPTRAGQTAPIGLLGDAVVTNAQHGPWVIGFDGPPQRLASSAYVAGVDERLGLVSGTVYGLPRGVTTGVVADAGTGSARWSKPGWTLDQFSPDGSMVLGTQYDGDTAVGWGVFDARTGKQLHEFAMPRGLRVMRVAWEDDEHLLMSTAESTSQAILRTSLDGAIQRATGTVPFAGTDDLHFRFAP